MEKDWRKKKTLWDTHRTILIVCVIFMVWWALNPGFSKFYMAIPFFITAILVASMKLNLKWIAASFLVGLLSIVINLSLLSNPLVFPILYNWKVEILKDGYHWEFSDWSWWFKTEKTDNDIGLGKLTYTALNKWDIYDVTWVKVWYPDFGFSLAIQTKVWDFQVREDSILYSQEEKYIQFNKSTYAVWAKYWSYLMYWPILFIAWFPLGFILLIGWIITLVYLKRYKKKV